MRKCSPSICAETADSRRGSSTGNARRAADGKRSSRAGPPSSKAPAAILRGCSLDNRRVIVALDVPDSAAALALAARLDPALCRVKVGKELFVAAGPAVVEALQKAGFEVFLDLKFHDIPNTVAGACRSAPRLGVWMLNVDASGREALMRPPREARPAVPQPPFLLPA